LPGPVWLALFPRAIGGQFRNPVRRPVDQHVLRSIVDGLLAVHEQVAEQQAVLDERVRQEAKADETTRRLMSVPGVGIVTALAFVRRAPSAWPEQLVSVEAAHTLPRRGSAAERRLRIAAVERLMHESFDPAWGHLPICS
jgi:transposase